MVIMHAFRVAGTFLLAQTILIYLQIQLAYSVMLRNRDKWACIMGETNGPGPTHLHYITSPSSMTAWAYFPKFFSTKFRITSPFMGGGSFFRLLGYLDQSQQAKCDWSLEAPLHLQILMTCIQVRAVMFGIQWQHLTWSPVRGPC